MKPFMKILKVVLLAAIVLTAAGCMSIEQPAAQSDCPYAGMYLVITKGIDPRTKEYAEAPMTYFEVTVDWMVIGASDDSGYSGFMGAIESDGSFDCEMTNMRGSLISGTIDEDGHLVGTADFLQYGKFDIKGKLQG